MKPLFLRMSAFGPYAHEQILDFQELKGRSFFLIHGPTGSGKTSILDAICFALYGTTSGNARTGKSMRSDHADLSVPTEVEFEFAIGDKQYKVKRLPEQERPSKRGGGTTVAPAKAELYLRSAHGTYELIAGSWREVTEKVETILGFKSEQFRQVVLLPQGDFRKLLTATSEERQAIMQTLFKTGLYSLIEEKLKNKAKELIQQRKDLLHGQELILQEANVTTLEELEIRLEQNLAQEAELKKKVSIWDEKLKIAQEEITTASRIQDQWNERKAAEAELKALMEKLPTVNEYRKNLERALAAATLVDTETLLTRQVKEVKDRENQLNAQEKALQVAQLQLEKAQDNLAAEENRASEREAAAAELHRLQQLSETVAALNQARDEAMVAKKALDTALERKKKAQLKLEENQKLQSLKSEQAQKDLLLAGQSEGRRMEFEKLQTFLAKRRSLETEKEKLHEAERKLSAAERHLAEAETTLNKLKQISIALQQAWLNGQAGIMASRLTPGNPCPVCGSTHHPHPAAIYTDTPDELTLKRKQAELEQAEQNWKTAQDVHHQQKNEHDLLAQKVQTLTNELDSYADMELSELIELMEQAQTAYQETLEAAGRWERLQKELANLNTHFNRLKDDYDALDQAWLEANEFYQKAQTKFEEREASVPLDLRAPQALQNALEQSKTLQKAMLQALENAQKAFQDAKENLTKQQANYEGLQLNLAQAQERLRQIESDFKQRLAAAGFTTVEDYLKAKWTSDKIKKVQDHIKQFELNLSAAQQRAARAQEKIQDLPHPDLQKLQEAAATLKTEYDSILTQYTTLRNTIQNEKRWLARLNHLKNQIEKTDSRYAVIGRLSEVANGQNDYRLTLQRFVLGALLDDVTLAANERLKTMSRGRYYLQRTMDRARKNMAGGLDLEVFDNYTGIARGVGTLSGGETFLASLSLALGLVDVVQSYAGGIHLDTLFVDEGFGTLDPESLDFAVKALIDLQQGGRLVGIISHVPELKERIDARLEVTPTSKGSVAAFKVR